MDEFTIALNSLLWSAADTEHMYLGQALKHYLFLAEDLNLTSFYSSAQWCASKLIHHFERKDCEEIFNEYFKEHTQK
jgi:hypothetical protein